MIIKERKEEIINYLSDAANFRGECNRVIIPESLDELTATVKEANINKEILTVSGNGTGLTGGRVPKGGSVLSIERLNKILEIDADKHYAVVQGGVLLNEFLIKIEELKLFYPPDPTETNCFLGSNVALNSSGARSFKYGSTRNFVESVRVALPTGDLLELRRGKNFAEGLTGKLKTTGGNEITLKLPSYKMPEVKNAAGYYAKPGMDLIDLFIGSEGTLGIIAEVKLKLLNKPTDFLSAIIFFDRENEALDFIDDARTKSRANNNINQKSINALSIEFFDSNALNFLRNDFPSIPEDAQAAVWIEQDIFGNNLESILNDWMNLIEKYSYQPQNSWVAMNKKEREKIKNFRHSVSSKISEYISRNNLTKVGTDTAVPVTSFREYYSSSKKLVESNNINYVVYGHFGDCHMHLNMLPKNKEELNTAKKLYFKLCQNAVELKGTVSAEHGIGKFKTGLLELMYGEKAIKEMASVKKKLDKNLILNIGNVIDERFLK